MQSISSWLTKPIANFVLLLWLGVLYAQVSMEPVRSVDTESYVSDPVQLDVYFSLSGYAVRSWPSVLLFWSVDTDFKRTLLHSIFYALSWTAVLVTWLNKKPKLIVLGLGSLILILALSPFALQWNHFILAESLTISLLLFAFAAIKITFSDFGNNRFYKSKLIWLLFSTTLICLAAVNRASLIPMLLVPLAAVLIFWRQKIIGIFSSSLTFIFIFASIFYPLTYHSMSSKYVGDKIFPLERTAYNFMLNSAADGPMPHWSDLLWDSVTKDGPQCLRDNRGLWNSPEAPEKGPLGQTFAFPQTCPEAIPYLNENSNKKYAQFIISNPIENFKFLFHTISGVGGAFGMPMTTMLPSPFATIYESRDEGTISFRPIISWIAIGIFLSIYFLFIYRRAENSIKITIALFFASFLSIAVTELMIVLETVRTASPATIATFLASTLLLFEFIEVKFFEKSTK